ncbi:hypothetical protein RGU70_13595 [Herbaspirillum sp. RTI4]|uniref:hypothetical protein n=1 Tax=Herbaspirillum sp. RTI4 TaxID=3048640 RepID=UPI002AB49BB4|nr:hypothetical protein [Herbaspirillum sp. RTI4]MDY7579347.1 hypothetical protein [Herbaspirillum sp. RTI4]MEA9980261.1 hypothetical protein [Herbaspirillum sp. RTI4]
MLTKIVDGVTIELTADEETAQLAEWVANATAAAVTQTVAAWEKFQQTVQAELEANDVIYTRCGKAGVAYPPAWLQYDIALRVLRKLISGDPTQALPTKPEKPTGI